MRRIGTRTAAGVALMVGAALLLAGCTAAPTSAAKTTSTPGPFGVECPMLTTEAKVSALLGGSAAPATTPWRALDTTLAQGPYLLQAAGGTTCQWGDGTTRGMAVSVMPRGTDGWDSVAESDAASGQTPAAYAKGSSSGADCDDRAVPRITCHANVLVGDTWMAVSAFAAGRDVDEKAFHALVQSMIPTVEAYGRWAPALAPTPDCADAAWSAELSRIAGAPVDRALLGVAVSIDTEPLRAGSADSCDYSLRSGSANGTVSVARDAGDAFSAYRTLALAKGHARSITVEHDGRRIPAIARTVTTDDRFPARTAVDVLVDGTWVQYLGWDTDEKTATAFAGWVSDRV